MSGSVIDHIARRDASKALDEIQSHEDLCAERYSNINETLKTIKTILGWAGTTIFGLLVCVLGWLIVQQIGHNDNDRALLETKLELLQQRVASTAPAPASGPTAR